MAAKILDGKKLSERILECISQKVEKENLKINLGVILIGDNAISEAYINKKRMACEQVGIGFELFHFLENIETEELKKEIEKIVYNSDISGVIIQLPLPEKFIAQDFLNLVPEEKDVDVLSEKSFEKFSQGSFSILPPPVSAVSQLLEEYNIDSKGKNVVVVGAGKLIGQPLAIWFRLQGAIVSVVDSSTENPATLIKNADILISGVGKPHLITGEMVKEGAVVIDAGTSGESGKMIGDVDFESVSQRASFITPVPGGVGPMTVACLIENVVKLKQK